MLEIRRDGPVSVLELQRDERRNALNLELCREIDQAAADEVGAGQRALVITGQGSAFCAGADLGGVYGPEFLDALYGMLHGLTKLPVPVIAAVNGAAIGAGTQLAIACDLRVAAPRAKFGVPTARNGMAVDDWTINTLQTIAGGGAARRLMIGAEMFDIDQAAAYGLIDRRGDVDDAVSWAQELATLAPLTLAYNKHVLNQPADAEGIAQGFQACWDSDDVAEAATARTEKRAPVFRGR